VVYCLLQKIYRQPLKKSYDWSRNTTRPGLTSLSSISFERTLKCYHRLISHKHCADAKYGPDNSWLCNFSTISKQAASIDVVRATRYYVCNLFACLFDGCGSWMVLTLHIKQQCRVGPDPLALTIFHWLLAQRYFTVLLIIYEMKPYRAYGAHNTL